ncbi:MAG: NAD(P)/FAD-dependent oxidoreductase [Nitrospirae bacterium]|nr:NAD(P)/FAD-dependent oxidoreductase [Nitrospirota bacterium]
METSRKRPRVVVVGAGFGGLWTAKRLARYPVDVILVDRNNYHTFLPLLYQVAAAEVGPEEISSPIRTIVRDFGNTEFTMADITGIDLKAKVVLTRGKDIHYDFLVLAIGSVSNFFGIPGAEEHAFPLKTMDDGIDLRNHILSRFELAYKETDLEERRRMLTFTIVGGGPTGVEYAGALAELIRGPVSKDYPGLGRREVRVVLVEAQDHVLGMMPEALRAYALRRLRSMGVEVLFGTSVRSIAERGVMFHDGTVLPTETVVWTSGVQGEPRLGSWGLPQTAGGRIAVLPTLQVAGHPEVYVVGDLAGFEEDGRFLPQVAPVANQQGAAAADNIERQVRGVAPMPFRYRDPGIMVTIGKNAAVARLAGISFTGFAAWLLWLFVHLMNLIGFRNRIVVLIDWGMDYFFADRSARLMLSCRKRPGTGNLKPGS